MVACIMSSHPDDIYYDKKKLTFLQDNSYKNFIKISF